MSLRMVVLLVVLGTVRSPALAAAQVATGEIYGKVSDASGAVLPGVAVTLTSPVLLQPLAGVTSETGTYRFPLIPIGVYSARFELAGFRTVVNEGIRIEIGLNAQINATLDIGGVEETVQVKAVSPVVDLKDAGKTNRFTREALQAIPSARDPWAIIEQSAGVAMDRQNVGGSASGTQGTFAARGATWRDSKWNLDGVDITDMVATGGSPIYYDFDAFEEIQVTTAGADVTMQSSGLAINLVTKSGTDQLRGSGRYYVTDDAFQSNNVTDELRRQGVNTGNPIQNIRDYGVEAGGPLVKGRAWVWGSYGTQKINVGINNFYKPDASCQAMKADPLSYSLEEIRTCLMTDTTILKNYNLKFALHAFTNNQLSFFFNAAAKIRDTRGASDLRPLESTYRQMGVTRADLGSHWWTTGIPKTYKWTDRHIFSDRFMVEGQYAHVGANFAVTFHDESLRSVQPANEITTGAWSRSSGEDANLRPTDSVDLTGNYFLPSVLGGDHALKFGFKYRNDTAYNESMTGGDAYARFRNDAPAQAQLFRRAKVEYGLQNRSFYVQDTFTRGRVTINAGFRLDHQDDYTSPSTVPASPFYGQSTFAGVYGGVTYTGQPFTQLPSMTFGGVDPDVAFTNVSPRAGVSVDLTGSGHSVLKFYYARYVGQLGAGPVPGAGPIALVYNTVASTYVRYPWVDLNGDRFIQASEIVLTPVPLSWTSGYDYTNPSWVTTSGSVDPNLSADHSQEIIVSVDRELMPDFAVTASYIWRRYNNFRWDDSTNWTGADYVPVRYQPTGCPSGARCDEVTYYNPVSPIPVAYVFTNQPDFWRGYQGLELTARKRLTKGWMMNASFSYNDARVHYDSAKAYEDPTNIENLNNAQFAPESISSGLGNVFVNSTWIFRVSGSYRTPFWGINLAGSYNSRSGYPFIANIQTPSRPNGGDITNVYLDDLGDNRLDTFQTLDFRVDRQFTFGRLKIIPAMDVFNLLNGNTPLSIQPVQNVGNANQISSILAARVIRFGIRAEW
jgi:hypothetical protein